MENKTKYIKVRVTPEELENIKRRSIPFGTVSSFIHHAVKEFSDTTVRERMDKVTHLSKVYADIDAKLAHVGGNLNQAMRRINEAAKAGIGYSGYLTTDLLPAVQGCMAVCMEVRSQLYDMSHYVISR